MAYITDLEEEKEKQKDGAQSTSGVVDSTATGGAATGKGPVVDTKAPTSSGFVNLQQYLDANKGAGAKMASESTKELSESADTYKKDADAAVQSFQKDSSAAAGDDDAAKLSSRLATDASGAYSDAAAFLGSSYGGPQAGTAAAELGASKEPIQGNLNKVDDTYYQKDLLRQTYGKDGHYTSGFGALDSFLMNGEQSGRDVISGVKAKAGEVGKAYDDAAARINQSETDARNKLAANQASLKDNARKVQENIVKQGLDKVGTINKGINRDFIETSDASLGDALSDKDRLDLEALANLAGADKDAAWYRKTFSSGRAKPVEVQAAATAEAAPSSGNGGGGGGGGGQDSPIIQAPNIVDEGPGFFKKIARNARDMAKQARDARSTSTDGLPIPSGPQVNVPSVQPIEEAADNAKGKAKDKGNSLAKTAKKYY